MQTPFMWDFTRGRGKQGDVDSHERDQRPAVAYDDEIRIDDFLPLVGDNKEIFSMLYPGLDVFIEDGLKAWGEFILDKPLKDNHYFWRGNGWD